MISEKTCIFFYSGLCSMQWWNVTTWYYVVLIWWSTWTEHKVTFFLYWYTFLSQSQPLLLILTKFGISINLISVCQSNIARTRAKLVAGTCFNKNWRHDITWKEMRTNYVLIGYGDNWVHSATMHQQVFFLFLLLGLTCNGMKATHLARGTFNKNI